MTRVVGTASETAKRLFSVEVALCAFAG